MSENRCRIARETAGLSLGQAAKILGIGREMLGKIEEMPRYEGTLIDKMVDTYQVRQEWITGKVPRHDYASIDKMIVCSRGQDPAEPLTPHDRDILAQFAASMPRSTKTVSERLEEVRKKNNP